MWANNPYLKDHDKKRLNAYIHCLDANNLYGQAMCQPFLLGGFCWCQSMPTESETPLCKDAGKKGISDLNGILLGHTFMHVY